MRRALSIVVFLAGCGSGPASSGAVEIDTRAERGERDVDVYLATQVELLSSAPLLERALERLGAPSEASVVRDRVSVERRGDSSIVDVRVSVAGDPREAAEFCNAILEAYIEHRFDRVRATATPREIEAMLDVGARVLERCRLPVPR